MPKKLYVGNLPFSVTNQDLMDMFAECGTVESADLIIDRDTQRSKGFGFVEMANDNEAQAAIEKFDGQDYNGRSLKVNEARPMQKRNSGGGNRGFGGGRRGGRSSY